MTFSAITFGPFPHELVNRTLGTELVGGDVYFSVRAQRHMLERHPADFPIIMPNLVRIVQNPTWLGQAPNHGAAIEFVKRIRIVDATEDAVPLQRIALLAVSIEPDQWAAYRIQSGYLIDQRDVDSRLAKRRLFSPK